jgi:N-sulfoglucosamine sulfohydrolase
MINWADLAPTIADFAGLNHEKLGFQGRSFRSVLETEEPDGWDCVYASHTFHEVTMYQPMRVVRRRRHKLIWNIVHDLDLQVTRDLRESSTWRSLAHHGHQWLGSRPISALRKRPEFELYDIDQDPDEIRNLAGRPEHSGLLSAMIRELREFQERTKDPWVIAWEATRASRSSRSTSGRWSCPRTPGRSSARGQ